ncbi:MAG: glycosyltransferase family 39 protein, partial [Anaerolineales bacterium]|nr:glycosyltransferase family 39 protein [Anaerolineales bacterium]
ISSNYEWFQPALGYLPAAVIYKTLDIFAPGSLPREIPPLNPQFCSSSSTHPNLFTHPSLKVFEVWKNGWGLVVIRILSSLWGIAVIYAAYRIGCICDKNEGWLGIVAAGWVAFLPQFTFVNANARSDTLTNAIAALFFLLAVLMQTSPTRINKLALGIGVLLGLGLLSKYTFFYIVPVALLAAMLTSPRAPRAWLKPATLMVLPALVLVAAYYLTFDEARAALIHFLVSRAKLIALSPTYVSSIFPLLLDSFYGRFGWMSLSTPATWTRIGFGVWSIGAALTLWQIIRRHRGIPFLRNIAILGVGLLLAFAAVLYYNFSRYDPQGRFLFPILTAWAVFGFWGWWQILSARDQKIATIAALGFMLAFNLYALFFCLVPAYYK